MQVDMSYSFQGLKLTQNADKTISLSTEEGKEGNVLTYDKNSNDKGKVIDVKVWLPASSCKIYKENGCVHADFTVIYDTKDLKKRIPLIPDGTHKSLKSIITTIKQ